MTMAKFFCLVVMVKKFIDHDFFDHLQYFMPRGHGHRCIPPDYFYEIKIEDPSDISNLPDELREILLSIGFNG